MKRILPKNGVPVSGARPGLNLSKDEKDFLLSLLGQLNVNPADIDAGRVVHLVQSIREKLGALPIVPPHIAAAPVDGKPA